MKWKKFSALIKTVIKKSQKITFRENYQKISIPVSFQVNGNFETQDDFLCIKKRGKVNKKSTICFCFLLLSVCTYLLRLCPPCYYYYHYLLPCIKISTPRDCHTCKSHWNKYVIKTMWKLKVFSITFSYFLHCFLIE